MADPMTFAGLGALIQQTVPAWLGLLGGTVLTKSGDAAFDVGKNYVLEQGKYLFNASFQLDEKEQVRHLSQALKNAMERGLIAFQAQPERDLYKSILTTLAQDGPAGDELRRETLTFFTLNQTPDLDTLSELYNRRQHTALEHYQDIDAGPYLNSFFSALLGELYADPYYRPQLSAGLQLRAMTAMQHSLLDVVSLLKSVATTLSDHYSAADFEQDVEKYATHMERTLRNLKIVGVVPKDQNADPEIGSIFVPLRIDGTREEQPQTEDATEADEDELVSALEQHPCLVLLGGPGSGKSTAAKHIAWRHAAAQNARIPDKAASLLTGKPLPLYIELRRLSQERKRASYDFLTFASDVLLKRDSIDINPHMFKELLARHGMLLLFDGLDEVATLNERLELVQEIEHFALRYPGNRILVTSRPVGYEQARISHLLFTHSEVQPFNDQQMRHFLENWYTAVLRLSPIPHQEREEMELLLTTLKENPRLHKLGENPLLLTVITALHRYERLPDRRAQVYDRCADLLLETWAKTKGTHARWQHMKMGKEDQYACLAHLGFVLHRQSQEGDEDESASQQDENGINGASQQDAPVDVSARELKKQVEIFLRQQNLIAEKAEQRVEAANFIELVEQEAGLIVERGTDETGAPLYGFVHRTFQEYFAAADVYERYQQESDLQVMRDFLHDHLHDPHWREVILLLLGKLRPRPVTILLTELLNGTIKSRRSIHTEIIQQDLFFISECLIEEIKVENTLVELVVKQLCQLVRTSHSTGQRQQALQYLGDLTQTRQYNGQGKAELEAFITKDDLDTFSRLQTAYVLYKISPPDSDERKHALHWLDILAQKPDVPMDKIFENSFFDFTRMLSNIFTQHLTLASDYPYPLIHNIIKYDMHIFFKSEHIFIEYENQSKLVNICIALFSHSDLSLEQTCDIAPLLYRMSYDDEKLQQDILVSLTTLLQRPDLTLEQLATITSSLGSCDSAEAEPGTSALIRQLQRPDLSIEQLCMIADALYWNSQLDSEPAKQADNLLLSLLQYPDLSIDQSLTIADLNQIWRLDRKQSIAMLYSLLKRPDLSTEQIVRGATTLYYCSPIGSNHQRFAAAVLLAQQAYLEEGNMENRVYNILQGMVPHFDRLPSPEKLPHYEAQEPVN
ncbi:NACHT domain-containing protein [Dictyobacter arantiisoli]|uniref:NACHT domain-containing protein n=1 Tax=Dictyobacter arantiisoli TaxID=2014874 RepID=A0A5A5TGE1_9CHLR|nr:NACHT domain-containing protein [Dictyobacter arantiisoli]GCF10650.1 hypothetical protein KDI_42140 [Dictyobacter arantiisoli]